MRITESQLRRIVREELNEMRKSGITLRVNPETGEYEESGMEDFPGMGAERARKMREPTMFRRPKITDPDLGDKFDRMMANLDLDDPSHYGDGEAHDDPFEGAAFSKEEIEDIQRGMYGKRR